MVVEPQEGGLDPEGKEGLAPKGGWSLRIPRSPVGSQGCWLRDLFPAWEQVLRWGICGVPV